MADEQSAKKSSGMDPKLAALLCWLFTPISSVIFMVLDDVKDDEFIQFNAKESLWFGLLSILLSFIPIINFFAAPIMFIVRIIIAVKAYGGEKVVLPVIGDMSSK